MCGAVLACLSSLTDEHRHLYVAPLTPLPAEFRKATLRPSVIKDEQPLSPEAPRVDKGPPLALTSSCLGKLLQA